MTIDWVIWPTRCSNGSKSQDAKSFSIAMFLSLSFSMSCFVFHCPCQIFVIHVTPLSLIGCHQWQPMVNKLPLCHWWQHLFKYSPPLTLMTKRQTLYPSKASQFPKIVPLLLFQSATVRMLIRSPALTELGVVFCAFPLAKLLPLSLCCFKLHQSFV